MTDKGDLTTTVIHRDDLFFLKREMIRKNRELGASVSSPQLIKMLFRELRSLRKDV